MNVPGGRRQEGRRTHKPREQDRNVQLSKALSYALRHGALKLGLPMRADGFVPLQALLQLPQFHSFSIEDVQLVVDTNEKQRFTMQPGEPSTGPLIRANQGHSLQVPELELIPLETPQALPLTLVHGTFWKHWPSILLKGLSRQGRTHIHLASGLPGDPGVISGIRPNCEVAVFIDGPLALSDGIPFFCSANGVILTPGNAEGFLLPKYFKEALQLRPTSENQPTTRPVLNQGPSALQLCEGSHLRKHSFLFATFISSSGKPLSLAGHKETESQSSPKHSSRGGRRKSQQ
ncbi:tRNA 2'-phosphotransferase 1 isoform X1 [Apodemus sylvaticus]|uniref:tRNA 2'-phosphotransferase 1 isoform X1 n=1 Tax=Apodemus sylvaticus TaxID=10129 RepID=UPI0022429EFE|nr:tRNA 2'-phosphotransferase 1 isoform X1 [Apodemus sylvaticus]